MQIPDMMKAVHFLGNGGISVDEVPVPQPQGEMVLIKIEAAAICGTDRENLEAKGQSTIPGHESAGQVVAVDGAKRVRVGDRVAVNCHITCGSCPHCLRGDLYFCRELKIVGFDIDGGFAEYALIPEGCLMHLPDDISFEVGALLVDMLGTGYRGVKRSQPATRQRAGIWGAGPVGLSALLTAKAFGQRALVVDFNKFRLDMARQLGADLILTPDDDELDRKVLDWTGGEGLDVVYECVGEENAVQQGLSQLKLRGVLGVIGVSESLTLDPWEQLICEEATIYGSRCFVVPEYDEMIALVRSGLPVTDIVTHRFSIHEAKRGFEVYRGGQCGKIVFIGGNGKEEMP
ncbi:MAG: zinc-dependent alcohol dehydrogenase [Anaerolineales bacterium]